MRRVINSPAQYMQENGLLGKLNEIISGLSSKSAFAVVDSFILDNYRDTLESSFRHGALPFTLSRFGGECCKEEVERIIAAMADAGSGVIIGIGGGKTLDTVKAVSYYTGYPVVVVPTAASSDAPCSALSVMYTADGTFERYLPLRRNPDMVLVDTAIIAGAPVRLLSAGMGDALATYFEARACHQSKALTSAGGICSVSALALARTCFETLMEYGEAARTAVENKTVTEALENVIEANTYLSGVGFESGGLAAAHAVHNGLTVVPETHHCLHGEKVAFGVLTQLVLEKTADEELIRVLQFCKNIGLPVTLAALGITADIPEKVMAAAQASCAAGETIYNLPYSVTPKDVYIAMLVADRIGAQ